MRPAGSSSYSFRATRRGPEPSASAGPLLWAGVVACLALAVGLDPPSALAQVLSNNATGASRGVGLDQADATVTLNRTLVAAPPSLAEVSPNTVDAASRDIPFTLDILPAFESASPAVSRFTITLPAGFTDPVVLTVTVGGAALAPGGATLAPGQYRATIAGATVVVELGGPLDATADSVRVQLTADAPAASGQGAFACALEAPGGATASVAGDADGDAADGNSLDVVVLSAIDLQRSTLTADPPVVLADGVAASRITVRLLDHAGQPLPDMVVLLSSSRGAPDVIEPPAVTTDATGSAVATIRSPAPGQTQIVGLIQADDLEIPMRPTVFFTQGQQLRLDKAGSPQEVTVGAVIDYTIAIRNVTTAAVSGVYVEDRLPPGFRYLEGSARLDGAPLPDPTGTQTLVFAIGDVAALIDSNGNGQADPGEPGYLLLAYRMVVGAGAAPGSYVNQAMARDVCPTCALSNVAEARVEVALDPLFGLGTILGRVYEDRDGDQRQGRDEPGVAGARVVLDDGTYALTDAQGLYHLVNLRPGHRLLKLDVHSLPGVARITTGETDVVSITPGLLATADFGVAFVQETLSAGHPAIPGLIVAAHPALAPLDVRGDVEAPTVLVNGHPIALPVPDARLQARGADDVIDVGEGDARGPLEFKVSVDAAIPIAAWRLHVFDQGGALAHAEGDSGRPPPVVAWDRSLNGGGGALRAGEVYQYQLEVGLPDGTWLQGPRRSFGVNRTRHAVLSLTGDAFASGRHALSPAATQALKELAAAVRTSPGELILVEGHTDSVGSIAANRELSLLRARAAAHYLVERERLPDSCLVVVGVGEERPIADNGTAEGRARNRRIELRRETTEVTRANLTRSYGSSPEVAVDGRPVAIDTRGRFGIAGPDSGADRLTIDLQGRQGETVSAIIALPRLEILSPGGVTRLPYGADGDGWTATASLCAAATDSALLGNPAPLPPAVTCPLHGLTDPGASLTLNGEPLAVSAEGVFAATLPLCPGENVFGLSAQNASGGRRLANLKIVVRDRDESGGPAIAVEALPELNVALPPQGAELTVARLVVTGSTAPGNRVSVNDVPVEVRPDGSFRAVATLAPERASVQVQAVDPAGRASIVARSYRLATRQFFFLAFADGVVGRLSGDGLLEGAATHEGDGYYTEGRLAYYLKGWVAGRYLVTSAFDSGVREFADLFADLDRDGDDRFFTRLDPDRLYPVYGDSCTIVHDAQSQGKFYLAVEGEDLNLTVGNYPLSLTGADLAAYRRTLFGGRAEYRSVATTRYGQPRTEVTVLGAELRQEHVRDELRGTGGSLYYLSQQRVLEGSEQVALVIRDQNTGLELARIPQLPQLDYTFKHEEGRLLFHHPVPSVVEGTSLVSTAILSGNQVFIEVDYERRAPSLDNSLLGARASRHLGDHLRVGGTYVHDDLDASGYELAGAEAEVRLGEGTRLSAEVAGSSGGAPRVFVSEDGGLTWTQSLASPAAEGDAWKATAELDIGEALGLERRLRTFGYVRRLDPGFYSGASLADLGAHKEGLGAEVDLPGAGTVAVRHDRERRLGGGLFTTTAPGSTRLTSGTWRRSWGRWDLAAQYQSRAVRDSVGNETLSCGYLAARLAVRLGANLSAELKQQSAVSGSADDRTSLGLRYQPLRSLSLQGEGMTGSAGRSLQGGAVYSLGRGNLYLREQLVEHGLDRRTTTVVGGEAPIGAGSRIYSEQQRERGPAGPTSLSVLGAEKLWHLGPGWQLFVTGEHGQKDGASVTTRRTSLSTSLAYARPRSFQARLRQEFRFDTGDQRRVQTLTDAQTQARLGRGLTASIIYRNGLTRNRTLDLTDARFEEGSLGLAYRPPHSDRLNLLARASRLHDTRRDTAATVEPGETELDVLAVEGSYRLTPWLELVGKDAVRFLRQDSAAGPAPRTRSMLVIGRLNWTVRGPWRLGAEYRVLSQREAGDRKHGWVNELMWDATRHLSLGAGYNHTDLSDDEFATGDRSVRGWFARIQGRY